MCTPRYALSSHLQARQNRLQLVVRYLLPRCVRSRLVRCIPDTDTDVACVPQQNNIRLPRQPRASADVRVPCAQKSRGHPSRNELELAGTVALAIRDLAEVDVQEYIVG